MELNACTEVKHEHPATYNEFLKLLEDLESDELEGRYDLDEINHFLISFARSGLLPSDDAYELELDIVELLSSYDYPDFAFWNDSNYSMDPALLQRPMQIMLCKNIF